jgi:hypothetical protein
MLAHHTMLAHRFSNAALAPQPTGDDCGDREVGRVTWTRRRRRAWCDWRDGHEVRVDVRDETVSCGDADTQKKVEAALKRIMSCMHPYAACSCPTA